MPVESCQLNGKPGFRWGSSGKCYTYTEGDKASMDRAKQKAGKQGQAAHASGYQEKSMQTENIVLTFPFTKVDKTKRTVKGVATADNIDPSGDKISFDASKRAFAEWIGNIREMHSPKAVGKALSFKEVPVFYNGRNFNGIEVEAYVSKGAEDTWQKVLDGTLQGWSVGGNIIDKTFIQDPETGREVRLITDYELGELSLVDNPGNPAATITLVKRAEDGELESELEPPKHIIYYSEENEKVEIDETTFDDAVEIGYTDDLDLDVLSKMVEVYKSGGIMKDLQNNAENDSVSNMELSNEQKTSVLNKFVTSLFTSSDDITKTFDFADIVKTTNTSGSSGVNIYVGGSTTDAVNIGGGEAIEKAASEIEEVSDDNEESKATDEEITKSESESDGGNEEMDIEKVTDALSTLLDEKLSKMKDEIKEEVQASVDEKIETVTKSVDEVKETVDTQKESVAKVEEEVEKFNENGAFKKSVESDENEEEETLEKSEKETFWKGIFVPVEVCEALGYDS